MRTAPDGSPIDVNTRLPEPGEGEIVASVLPAGGSVLELGCGTGRNHATAQRRDRPARIEGLDTRWLVAVPS